MYGKRLRLSAVSTAHQRCESSFQSPDVQLKTALVLMNVAGRIGLGYRLHAPLSIDADSRVGLSHPGHRPLKGSIHLRPDDGGDPLRLGPALAHRPAHERFCPDHDPAGVV